MAGFAPYPRLRKTAPTPTLTAKAANRLPQKNSSNHQKIIMRIAALPALGILSVEARSAVRQERAFKPIAAIAAHSAWAAISDRNSWVTGVGKSPCAIIDAQSAWSNVTSLAVRGIAGIFESPASIRKPESEWTWSDEQKVANSVYSAGWLPHYTTPVDLVADHIDDTSDQLGRALDDYYAANWHQVSDAIKNRISNSGADSETIACINEAIGAHTAGYYRASCRTIFPEMERAVRDRFYAALGVKRSIANLRQFREAIGNLYMSDFREIGGWWAFRVFCVFTNECYVDFDPNLPPANDPSPVPNRHAVAHGLAPYSTRRDSLNCLFLADFCLAALDAMTEKAKAA